MGTKNYKLIEFTAGASISAAVEELKRENELCCGLFNGIMLYSDKDDIDSAYKKLTGKTKDEFYAKQQEFYEEEKKREEEYKKSIPTLTKEWIKKGKAILDKEYYDLWEEVVPIRLNDLYEGMELGASLEIIEQLNKGCDLSTAKQIIESQNHSANSFYLVASMVFSLCKRGSEFVKYIQ